MSALGPMTISCPTCGQAQHLETRVLGRGADGEVLLAVDATEARKHATECAARRGALDSPAASKPSPIPEQRTSAPRVRPASQRPTFESVVPQFIIQGPRGCTMCGTTNGKCLQSLRGKREACCPSCAEGDTHSVAAARQPCAEWAAEHGPKH